jgi:hypothetical protein
MATMKVDNSRTLTLFRYAKDNTFKPGDRYKYRGRLYLVESMELLKFTEQLPLVIRFVEIVDESDYTNNMGKYITGDIK